MLGQVVVPFQCLAHAWAPLSPCVGELGDWGGAGGGYLWVIGLLPPPRPRGWGLSQPLALP